MLIKKMSKSSLLDNADMYAYMTENYGDSMLVERLGGGYDTEAAVSCSKTSLKISKIYEKNGEEFRIDKCYTGCGVNGCCLNCIRDAYFKRRPPVDIETCSARGCGVFAAMCKLIEEGKL